VEFVNTILTGDCIEKMAGLPDGSVNCCVTSPPYYGLRDYGVDGQIGLEESPEAYVAQMVEVFRGVKRLLRGDGTLWLNLGDTYSGSNSNNTSITNGDTLSAKMGQGKSYRKKPIGVIDGLKPKDLIGIPWMVAFALRADGWYLRQDIIWHKPNPMPESVTDRCTKAHEYIFLMSKSARYYYDVDAIKEDTITPLRDREKNNGESAVDTKLRGCDSHCGTGENRNKRSVWTVTTKPFSEAHFATFPENLIVDMIKAGCPEGGIVLDPFMGAGTTALVAHKLNRNYIGSEINPDYCKIAEKRLLPHKMQQKLF